MHRSHEGPADIIAHALWLFAGRGLHVTRRSRCFRAPAALPADGPDLVFAAVELRSDSAPEAVRETLSGIEAALERTPRARPEGQIIALEIAAGGTQVNAGLHADPRMLKALADIVPDWQHPRLGQSVAQMLAALGPGPVRAIVPIEEPDTQRDVAE